MSTEKENSAGCLGVICLLALINCLVLFAVWKEKGIASALTMAFGQCKAVAAFLAWVFQCVIVPDFWFCNPIGWILLLGILHAGFIGLGKLARHLFSGTSDAVKRAWEQKFGRVGVTGHIAAFGSIMGVFAATGFLIAATFWYGGNAIDKARRENPYASYYGDTADRLRLLDVADCEETRENRATALAMLDLLEENVRLLQPEDAEGQRRIVETVGGCKSAVMNDYNEDWEEDYISAIRSVTDQSELPSPNEEKRCGPNIIFFGIICLAALNAAGIRRRG